MKWPDSTIFSLFGGGVVGEILEVKENEVIVMSWRSIEWNDGHMSKVKIIFEKDGPESTKVHLTHTGVPNEDKHGNPCLTRCEDGWKQNIFDRMEMLLGYPRNKDN
eukprot:GHVN01007751.1.p1 GENE.GHVN01007751.1~~GHVN01007751.1.p1  ORF type:complete len:106 (+),score=24.82 GHVN01007751.1:149-466(+)